MSIIFIRTLIVFISIIVSMRMMGKRQLGELELSELVVAVMISDVAANPLQDIGIPLLNGLIPIVVLLCCQLIISTITMKSVRGRILFFGKPNIIIENGVINQREMKKNRFTLDELTEELRNHGITDISTVQYGILETSGQLNVILTPKERPATAGQLGVEEPDTGYATIVINDGKLLNKNLKRIGRDENWLAKELKKNGAKDIKDVYIMVVNGAQDIFFARKEGKKK